MREQARHVQLLSRRALRSGPGWPRGRPSTLRVPENEIKSRLEKPQGEALAERRLTWRRQTLGVPADLRLVVGFLRSLRKWTQEELSRASGVDRGMISDYELGIKIPTRKALQRLAAGVGLPYRFVEILLPVFGAARLPLHGTGGSPETEAARASRAGWTGPSSTPSCRAWRRT